MVQSQKLLPNQDSSSYYWTFTASCGFCFSNTLQMLRRRLVSSSNARPRDTSICTSITHVCITKMSDRHRIHCHIAERQQVVMCILCILQSAKPQLAAYSQVVLAWCEWAMGVTGSCFGKCRCSMISIMLELERQQNGLWISAQMSTCLWL